MPKYDVFESSQTMSWMPEELLSAPDKVFVLASPTHVLHKLHWEIIQLKKALVSEPEKIAYTHAPAYYAFNCAVTAWHLADWVWEASSPDQRAEILQQLGSDARANKSTFQKALMEKCRAIHICRQIATGSKHMTVTQHPDPNVRVEMRWDSAPAGEVKAGYHYRLLIHDGGVERPAVDIFEEALKTWNRWLEQWYLKESSPYVVGKPLNRP
jgi:hypothetical protein